MELKEPSLHPRASRMKSNVEHQLTFQNGSNYTPRNSHIAGSTRCDLESPKRWREARHERLRVPLSTGIRSGTKT